MIIDDFDFTLVDYSLYFHEKRSPKWHNFLLGVAYLTFNKPLDRFIQKSDVMEVFKTFDIKTQFDVSGPGMRAYGTGASFYEKDNPSHGFKITPEGFKILHKIINSETFFKAAPIISHKKFLTDLASLIHQEYKEYPPNFNEISGEYQLIFLNWILETKNYDPSNLINSINSKEKLWQSHNREYIYFLINQRLNDEN